MRSHYWWARDLRVITARVKFNYLPNNGFDAHKRMVDSVIVLIHYSGSHDSADAITNAFPERPLSLNVILLNRICLPQFESGLFRSASFHVGWSPPTCY
jgi:hypothetical protein